MKFNLPNPIAPLLDRDELAVGNVYACKGGGKTRYWVVIGFDDRAVNLIGINADGAVSSTANYGAHVFNKKFAGFGRDILGRCEGLDDLTFDVIWKELP
jgi:hypothetical protein